MGAPAKSARIAYGALIIKERLGISDKEFVNQITENSYLQYFLSLKAYQETSVFDSSMMVHFRKKFIKGYHQRINSKIIQKATSTKSKSLAYRPKARKDEIARIPAEGKFGNTKRKGTLARIMAKLVQTSESVIHVGIIVPNLDKWLREVLMKTSMA